MLQGMVDKLNPKLQKLMDLYKDCVITGYEYEKEKKKLIK